MVIIEADTGNRIHRGLKSDDRGGVAHPSFKHARSTGGCWVCVGGARVSPLYHKATNGGAAKNSAPKTNFLGRFFSPCADHKDFDAAHADIAFRPGLWRKLSSPWRFNIPAWAWRRTQVALLGFCGATNFIQPQLLSSACSTSARVSRCL